MNNRLNLTWVSHMVDDMQVSEKKRIKLVKFWEGFFIHYLNSCQPTNDISTKSKPLQYKESVFRLLEDGKSKCLDENGLKELEKEIEDITIQFIEKSMYKTYPNIIKQLIQCQSDSSESAKDYLKSRLLDPVDLELISEFNQYTIEALIVHVLGMVFNAPDGLMVRVASLIEHLESSVRKQAVLFRCRRCKESLSKVTEEVEMSRKRSIRDKYPIGTSLMEFLLKGDVITLISDKSGDVQSATKSKKGAHYFPRTLFAACNFDLSLLPIKLNLPMVCPPEPWKSVCPKGESPRTLSDLSGGYLSAPSGDIYDRYRLLSSGDISHFYIDISGKDNATNLCRVMNTLQSQAFQINSVWLQYIKSNENKFLEYGYILPSFLASINISKVSTLLREYHLKDVLLQDEKIPFSNLLNQLCKNIQRARYEQLIFRLATAYDGYSFYLPAFLDFRGRIYRCGILHFHERDLARSLILFAPSDINSKNDFNDDHRRKLYAATAFLYQSFDSETSAIEWFEHEIDKIEENSFEFARKAKRPFQFLANLTGLLSNNDSILRRIPITQDASASAYQIMSYFLLDETLAKRTNLIPSSEDKINDIYSYFLLELKEFLPSVLEQNLSTVVCTHINRKIVKSIFMPIIYGKTLMSTANDIRTHFSYYLTFSECTTVAKMCFQFWKTKYHGMECLIKLISKIGWIVSARDCPVFYRVPYFTTIQDYMIMESIHIYVYNRLHKKRNQVTMRVSSSKRNRRKTEIATFVNFIHQRDAHIAMTVVDNMLYIKGAPIYTVHDNFISSAEYCDIIPMLYSNTIYDLGSPLSIINEFIYMNIIKPIDRIRGFVPKEGTFSNKLIPKDELEYYLRASIPETISKNKMKPWEDRISVILSSYENYTRLVCGTVKNPKKAWEAHERKWDKFKLQQHRRDGLPSYCVHY